MNALTPTMSELAAPRKPMIPIWVVAALLAVALHAAGLAFVLLHRHDDDIEDALGAPAIEIGLDMTAPHEAPTDLPPGPVADESAASPAVAEQKAVVDPTDLPKAVPTETDDPDRVVAPQAPIKPPDEDPTKATVETKPSTESVASEAAAPPSSLAVPESTRSVAPAQGVGESAARIRATWQKQLVAHLDKHKRFPAGGARRGAQVVVTFTLDRMGHVVSARILRSSGERAFDQAALAMLHRSDPVPQPPPLVADEGLTFTIPVLFRVNRRK